MFIARWGVTYLVTHVPLLTFRNAIKTSRAAILYGLLCRVILFYNVYLMVSTEAGTSRNELTGSLSLWSTVFRELCWGMMYFCLWLFRVFMLCAVALFKQLTSWVLVFEIFILLKNIWIRHVPCLSLIFFQNNTVSEIDCISDILYELCKGLRIPIVFL